MPDNLDVVEFGRVFWQPLDGEPVFARLDGFKSELADTVKSVLLPICPPKLAVAAPAPGRLIQTGPLRVFVQPPDFLCRRGVSVQSPL